MKKNGRIFSVILTVTMIATLLGGVSIANAVTSEPFKLKNTTQRDTAILSEGVRYTSVTAEKGAYSSRSAIQFDVVDIDMSQKNLYIANQYSGSGSEHGYNADVQKLTEKYNAANPGKTAIAAINADLWWMYTGSAKGINDGVQLLAPNSGGYGSSLAFSMQNGEIITSDRMLTESYISSSASLHYADTIAFGITSDFVPVISNPNAQVQITNTTQNTTAQADGINRTPANNSLVVYTDKGPTNIRAAEDAVQVKIKITSTADYVIKHGTDITGKVEGVYKKGVADPTMTLGSNYIILTARGRQEASITNYKTGDTVNLKVSIIDQAGKYTEQWQKVTDAVGGHSLFAQDGSYVMDPPAGEDYPGTFIGITNSNHVVMWTSGATKSGSRQGITANKYRDVCEALDIKDCFMLDGGGSSQMYIKENGAYKYANNLNETPARKDLNALVLAVGPDRGAQGSIPPVPQRDNDARTISFAKKGNISYLGNASDANYLLEDDALMLSAGSGNDPHVDIYYRMSQPKINASKYKYLTIEYMIPKGQSSGTTRGQIFYLMEGAGGVSEGSSISVSYRKDGLYHKAIVDLSKKSTWTGTLSSLRYDFFNTTQPGEKMYIKSLSWTAEKPEESSQTQAPETQEPITPSAAVTSSSSGAATQAPVSTQKSDVTNAPVPSGESTQEAKNTDEPTDPGNKDNGEDDGDSEDDEDDIEENKGLSKGAVIGIIAGSVAILLGAAAFCVYWFALRKKE